MSTVLHLLGNIHCAASSWIIHQCFFLFMLALRLLWYQYFSEPTSELLFVIIDIHCVVNVYCLSCWWCPLYCIFSVISIALHRLVLSISVSSCFCWHCIYCDISISLNQLLSCCSFFKYVYDCGFASLYMPIIPFITSKGILFFYSAFLIESCITVPKALVRSRNTIW